jgi:hypothetical protein
MASDEPGFTPTEKIQLFQAAKQQDFTVKMAPMESGEERDRENARVWTRNCCHREAILDTRDKIERGFLLHAYTSIMKYTFRPDDISLTEEKFVAIVTAGKHVVLETGQ